MENDLSNIGIDKDALNEQISTFDQQIKRAEEEEALQESQPTEPLVVSQGPKFTPEQEDPRNTEQGWGIPAVAEELKSAVLGGLQDTVSSVQTFPERAID